MNKLKYDKTITVKEADKGIVVILMETVYFIALVVTILENNIMKRCSTAITVK